MNKAFLIGNLVVDPELKTVGNNIKVCNMRLAVNRKTENGSEADYYSLKAWRGLGENCAKYLKKGSKVAVCGDISTRTYNEKLYIEVNANEIEFLTPAKSQSEPKMTPVADQSELPF